MLIISGNKNQGKTIQIKRFVVLLQNSNTSFSGFYSEKIINDATVVGYDIVSLPKKEKYKFLRTVGNENQQKIGSFYIDDFALAEGVIQIKKAIINQLDFLIIDEVGKLELNNKGWCAVLESVFADFKGEIIMTVRTEFVEKVIQKWNLKSVQVIGTTEAVFKAYISDKSI